MQILRTLLLRLATTAVTLAGAAIIVFVVIRVVPGNPIAMMLPPGATEEDIRRLTALYGLDRSIPEQFLIWVGGVLQGDFGTSITARQPVLELVLGRLPATLELALMALVLAVLIGGATALAGTRERGTRVEAAVDVSNGMALSIPDFLWGLILVLLFGVLWPVFHISGRITPSLDLPFTTDFYLIESVLRLRFDLWLDLVSHMLLPALALAIPLAAIISQLLKQSLKETMHLDYVTLARTKGYGETRVITREALPNAILPTLTLVGVQFTFLIGGTVIIERLFSYEGLGNMAIDAVINRDLPLIQGIVLLFALIFTAVNLAVDLLYAVLNPRLRHA
ncbi:ABC transporter permease subunit [Microvirga tunisiensis]|uniref:ABC transporter permease subunit n=2 Tax=Pannonibacter tanglangensis TaxID=2750084 RepID=A0ABW9ZIJ2_9HYPH|nr:MULTISPECIES: ABC transporter permease [unclassified Pannonibacter]NBN63868.1 ABC transporter permease subunit [Pannonibacter sp. XCT-34]NBN77507.1 ABC transporter permease subunit [Pannonibacter sp. XCT-53]